VSAQVKTIGNCKYNSMWIGRCFGKEALPPLRHEAVICSGSTLGSYSAVSFYVETMLRSMDTVLMQDPSRSCSSSSSPLCRCSVGRKESNQIKATRIISSTMDTSTLLRGMPPSTTRSLLPSLDSLLFSALRAMVRSIPLAP
jgi:hypothetical protein